MLTSTLLYLTALAAPLATADVMVDGKKAFTLVRTAHTDAGGHKHLVSTFRDLEGRVALVMDARLKGARPVEVHVDQRQSKERGLVALTPERVSFEVETDGGATETDESSVSGIVYVGPALTTWMMSDEAWSRLSKGQSVEFTVAAWRRMSTYRFRLVPQASSDEDRLVLLMEPTNLIYRAFAKEMFYTFDRKTRRHLAYSGITALKAKDGDGDLEDISAEIVFRD